MAKGRVFSLAPKAIRMGSPKMVNTTLSRTDRTTSRVMQLPRIFSAVL